MLPIEKELQSWYLDHLVEGMVKQINGLAVYETSILEWLPQELQHLPRLSFDDPTTPHALLRQIGLGMDLFTVPFVSDATDAGIALDFTFPVHSKSDGLDVPSLSLGIDMWKTEHASSLSPLTEYCKCYTCTKHHRAYVQHLLTAKEMLGWLLIQLHNHAIMDSFFTAIRQSLQNGTFEEDVKAFNLYYEPKLPEKTGQGPRVRGYQFKANDHADLKKKNPKAFHKYDSGQQLLKAFHGQQPNEKPEVKDRIDDDALEGLMGLEHGIEENGDAGVQIEDDK
jgi:queuine tRNA-ribosyltransferase